MKVEEKYRQCDICGEREYEDEKGFYNTWIWIKLICGFGYEGNLCSVKCAWRWLKEKIVEPMERLRLTMGDDDSRILDLTTDVWGGAGPDCRTVPLVGCSISR